jgi:NADPH:quinone reductase-like Zn-dependent oxidoreductase
LTFERAPVPVAALGEVPIAVHAAAITFDELSTVPAADLARRPMTVSHVVSAALPLAGLTAWQALVDHAQVRAGERVLVHGGAGGVGALTVELAGILGADVTTTVRSDAHALVTGLGANHVIDTRTDDFAAGGPVYDVVIDTVGGETLDRSFTVLRPGGRLVTLSAPPPRQDGTHRPRPAKGDNGVRP